jgi:hypothetical protein
MPRLRLDLCDDGIEHINVDLEFRAKTFEWFVKRGTAPPVLHGEDYSGWMDRRIVLRRMPLAIESLESDYNLLVSEDEPFTPRMVFGGLVSQRAKTRRACPTGSMACSPFRYINVRPCDARGSGTLGNGGAGGSP